MASSRSTEGESNPDDQQIFETKLIDFNGFQVRIVAQDKNGPCPLIAVCNFLILKHKFDLVSLTVSAETLVSHVAEQLCQNAGDQDQELNQALEALPRFRTGIDVNIRFDKIDGFVDMPELAVFRLLKIPLYHGWMVDPQDSDTAKALGSKPYNILIEEVVNFRARDARGEEKNVLLEDRGFHQKGKGDLEEEEALLKALQLSCKVPGTTISHASAHTDDHGLINNTESGVQLEFSLSKDSSALSSCYTGMLSLASEQIETIPSVSESAEQVIDSRMKPAEKLGPVYEREVVVAKQVEKRCENHRDMNLSPFITGAKGLLIDTFLDDNKNQLTIYGLFALQEGLEDGELCVFFYSSHLSTMLKHKNELYVLVTDQGYVSQPDLVWGKLNEVNGDTVFVTGDFNIFRQDSWDEQEALTRTNNYLASSESSVLSNDEQLAAEFQQKKYENDLQQQPASEPALRVTTGLQVEPGSLEVLFDGADDFWNDSDSEASILSPPIKHYKTHESK
ncbi:hypothetical protein MKX01_042678 [Papaver californicum]|nr:hypothetical protein MKX01_042678 [Papaver californicum]